ncbi:hypothetical protein AIOL_002270 [Candidatus Rhodobacter oscarellae]|uniref:SnoaL-like domain-containing protein n=1 Tax=Candidatus Rhodobacter oscarellae TaxID=1675527 RepID=A0A0J9E652_9RHOB|nr:nuclear transport factor 2 family protein [Candidatus Rhodobacter lobularis]KMW57309.1 hypothetical protein AIOL_002270 [Candidatus Rhodobacter lobularis]
MALDPQAIERMSADYTEAWNSGDPAKVASFYAPDAGIVINKGDPHMGTAAMQAMVAGFYAAVPDLELTCDGVLVAGDHAVFQWTFTGHDTETKNPLRVSGWEEWDLGPDLKVKASRGWFDAEDYARQIAGE